MDNKYYQIIYTGMFLNLFNRYLDGSNIYSEYTSTDNIKNYIIFPVNILQNETIKIHKLEYIFLIRSYKDNGRMHYAFLQNNPRSKRATPCLHCHIDGDVCVVNTLTYHTACSFPIKNIFLAKKMIQLLKKILKREEPSVKYIKLTDLARIYYNGMYMNVSDIFMLTRGKTFYEAMNFKNKNRATIFNSNHTVASKLRNEKFSMARLQKALANVCEIYKKPGMDDKKMALSHNIYLSRKRLTFITAMKYLYNNHTAIMEYTGPFLLEEYGIQSVYERSYIVIL
jgi:hypothetical protein